MQRGQHVLVLFLLIFSVAGNPGRRLSGRLSECLAPSLAQTRAMYQSRSSRQCFEVLDERRLKFIRPRPLKPAMLRRAGPVLDMQPERLLRELSSLLADKGEFTALSGAVGRKTTFGIGEIRHIDNLLVGIRVPRLEQGIL